MHVYVHTLYDVVQCLLCESLEMKILRNDIFPDFNFKMETFFPEPDRRRETFCHRLRKDCNFSRASVTFRPRRIFFRPGILNGRGFPFGNFNSRIELNWISFSGGGSATFLHCPNDAYLNRCDLAEPCQNRKDGASWSRKTSFGRIKMCIRRPSTLPMPSCVDFFSSPVKKTFRSLFSHRRVPI